MTTSRNAAMSRSRRGQREPHDADTAQAADRTATHVPSAAATVRQCAYAASATERRRLGLDRRRRTRHHRIPPLQVQGLVRRYEGQCRRGRAV